MFYSGVLYTVTIAQNVQVRHFYIFLNISFYIRINIQINGWLDPFGCLLVLHIQHKIFFLKHLIMPQSFLHKWFISLNSASILHFLREVSVWSFLRQLQESRLEEFFPHMYCCSINTRGQYFTAVSLWFCRVSKDIQNPTVELRCNWGKFVVHSRV